MKNKYLLLLGRGIEGCGVTKFCVEWEKWFVSHGYDYDILAIDDKKWTRKNAHSFTKIKKARIERDEEFEFAQNLISDYNVVIINSLPPSRSSEQIVLDRFDQLVDSIKGKTVFIQHDHNNLSIIRNGCIESTCKKSDIIFSHATEDSDFIRFLKKNEIIDSGILGLFDEPSNIPTIPIKNFQPGMFFDEIRKHYWKPIEEQDVKHHKWIGRTSPFKGYDLMFEFYDFLKNRGNLITFEGLEESPAIIAVKDKYDFHNYLKKKIEVSDLSQFYNDLPVLFSQCNNHELMHRLSKCAFGYQLSRLDARFVEHSIEYTHAEVVCAGAIPVFRKSYFDNCYHKKTGNPISSDKDTGTLFLENDKSNWKEVVQQMEKLSSDNGLRDEWREVAFEYYKEHQDADKTFLNILKEIDSA